MPVGLLGGKIMLRAELPEALYSIVGVRGVDINLSIEGRGRRGPSNFLSWDGGGGSVTNYGHNIPCEPYGGGTLS